MSMHYLLQVYGDDDVGIREVLGKVYSQFEMLPKQMDELLNSFDLDELSNLCHKMGSSALLIGSNDLKGKLLMIEKDIKENKITPENVTERIAEIQETIPSVLSTIRQYMPYYEQ